MFTLSKMCESTYSVYFFAYAFKDSSYWLYDFRWFSFNNNIHALNRRSLQYLTFWMLDFFVYLKVDGNEKWGGLRFLQLLGISLGPWRSMSIFILNVLFAIKKHISFSALSSKMNRRFVWQKAMRIKQDLSTYNAPIYLRTECSERRTRRGPNKEKIREVKSGS